MHFEMTTSASGGTSNFAVPSKNIESIIDKISVEINGSSLQSANNLNQVYNLLLPISGGTDLKNKRSVYANGGDVSSPTANLTNEHFCIQNWLGFLGSVKPDVIDTSLLGNVRLTIQLANGNVLVKATSDGPTSATYQLDDVYFTVDVLDISDGQFYNLHEQYLKAGGQYLLPFDSYYTSLFSTSTMNQASRFSLSTNSLDWIAGAFIPAYNTLSAVNTNSGRSACFDTTLTGLTSYKFTVNNIQFPQYSAGLHDAWPLMLNCFNLSQDTLSGVDPKITKATWASSFGFCAQGFNLDTEPTERTVSGLNSLGTNMSISWESTGPTSVNYAFIVAKCSSILKVGAGRSIELIQ